MRVFKVVVNGQVYQVEVEEVGEKAAAHFPMVPQGKPPSADKPIAAPLTAAGGEQVVAILPGVVLEVRVNEGERVEAGQVLIILEAMKMENEVVAPCGGMVRNIRVEAGAVVNQGDLLLVLGE